MLPFIFNMTFPFPRVLQTFLVNVEFYPGNFTQASFGLNAPALG